MVHSGTPQGRDLKYFPGSYQCWQISLPLTFTGEYFHSLQSKSVLHLGKKVSRNLRFHIVTQGPGDITVYDLLEWRLAMPHFHLDGPGNGHTAASISDQVEFFIIQLR